MNTMIQALKGLFVVLALIGLDLALRWLTAGAITGVRDYDLESMVVLAFSTIAWIAYGWLVLAVALTVLEQLPGAIGGLAGAVAGRITTKTARALLRSGLGVAAVTPLTVGAAQATPGTASVAHQWPQSDPASATQPPGTTTSRTTEPRSTVRIPRTNPPTSPAPTTWRTTEPQSTVRIGGAGAQAAGPRATDPSGGRAPEDAPAWRTPEPPSNIRLTESAPAAPATDSRSTGRMSTPTHQPPQTHPTTPTNPPTPDQSHTPGTPTSADPSTQPTQPTGPRQSAGPRQPAGQPPVPGREFPEWPVGPGQPVAPGGSAAGGRTADGARKPGGQGDVPTGGRMRMGVPDRPTSGAPTRYTDLQSGVAARVVVQPGDSLWSIAGRELGPHATDEAIAARWPEWYAANRQVIGPDPDLILPGQVLRTPAAATGDHVPPTSQEK